MARVLRSVKGHVYAYEVARLGDGRREQRYIGPATEAEARAWQERKTTPKSGLYDAQGSPQNEVGIHLIPLAGDTTAGNVEGRGYWRDGQQPAAFLLTIANIYRQRTGHAPALAICAPAMVGELRGRGVEVRAAKVNWRMVILAGGDV